ncbi:MAG: hypothetical protein K2N05_06970 [Muribaculaceae bacterium]|nr:hypothetical protein [Muribaculaceae bacterium]
MKRLELKYDRSRKDAIEVTLPTSKSMAARALTIGALAGVRPEEIKNLPRCTDTKELSSAINHLLDNEPLPTHRCAEENPEPLCLSFNLGLGGTSLRFFTALAAGIPGLEAEIECAEPLKKRPLAPLCEALNVAGADIHYLSRQGYPPLLVKGTKIEGGNRTISAAISSQFVSAMIMCAPYWKKPLTLELTGEHPVSVPYIDMTVKMMQRAGAKVNITDNFRTISVECNPYDRDRIHLLTPEADWSAASYFYELALILTDREVRISSLTPPAESLQGDSGCASIFGRVGVETRYNADGSALIKTDKEKLKLIKEVSAKHPIEFDMSDTPDLVPALAVGLCLAGIHFHISGIGHLRHKESDRIAAIAIELEKIGYILTTSDTTMEWTGKRSPVGESETIDTYHDHRIAMAFAPAVAYLPYLSIRNPEVTEKSFPDYFDILKEAGFERT